MKKATNIMITLTAVITIGCSNIDREQYKENDIVIEQQSEKESQNTQSTDTVQESEASVVSNCGSVDIPDADISSQENNKIEISMEDVILIGRDEAAKYYDNLQLTSVYSYDNDYDRSATSGDDGKREWWYVNFANEENNFVSIMIVDGEVGHVEHFDQNGNNRLIDMDDVNMTADEAVQKAKDYGLVGGDPNNESHWVSGYNFKMSYASLVSSPNDYRIFLEVIGISPNGNFAHIYFDAATGELLLAEEEIEYSDGDVEWKSFI